MATYELKKEAIRLLATLSKLPLTPAEEETYLAQLKEIIEYVTRIKQLKTNSVEPTFNSSYLKNVFQSEATTPLTFSQEQALNPAPHKQDGYFVVPKILEHK